MSWRLEDNIHQEYLRVCKSEELFPVFRSTYPIDMIMENSNEEIADKYLEIALGIDAPLVQSLVDKDTVGSPNTIRRFGYDISPTTIRYIKTLVDLNKFFGDIYSFNIVEIGAGYGGLCKVINDAGAFINYYIYDLPEARTLQKRYLNEFGVKTEKFKRKHYHLCIAMYSWSELSEDEQRKYCREVIAVSKYSYIMLNYDIELSKRILRETMPNAEITEHDIFYGKIDSSKYAPHNTFIIVKQ